MKADLETKVGELQEQSRSQNQLTHGSSSGTLTGE